ncbi:hypothetical protein Lepto7376_1892 [[Leptolyngbya] sp. PCC 7376]|uniref:hypothetical protein n=1 Tax=[Leptolyngbya] sp. PCC 7376 TaxID=111781 RepID=UPI00029F1C30|nr:hypothetical protein [[Leptolyngbya] sp. PCC 7376]AFY38211.1 hypothetical protein Lepto7376_1892 [[Leptolyngbya] sp. PCC 7376]
MPEQTSFVREDAEQLLDTLRSFHETLKTEWSSVKNQWKNIDETWHDKQYEKYYPLFKKLEYIYQEAETKCEKYIKFVDREINIEKKDDVIDIASVIEKM